MARMHHTGWELNSQTVGMEADDVGSGGTGTILSVVTSPVRSGTYALRFKSGTAGTVFGFNEFVFTTMVTGRTYYQRFYFRYATLPNVSTEFIAAATNSGFTAGWELLFSSTGTLTLARFSNDAAIGSASSALSVDTWYRIEVAHVFATNTYTAYIDGVQFATGTGDTSAAINRINLGIDGPNNNTTAGEWFFDDYAINDDQGTAQNGLPGSGKIVHMHPDGAGDNNNALSGTFADVDEVTPDNGTTIAVLDADNDILDVTCEASSVPGIGASDTVTLVSVGIREAAASAAQESWALRVKSASGGTTTQGTTKTHDDTTYRTNGDAQPRNYTLVSYLDPTTGVAWTPTGTNSLDNMQIGVIAIDATPDINVSTLWALVEYIPAAPAGGSIKTLNGLAEASMKTVNGLANASVKTWNGLP